MNILPNCFFLFKDFQKKSQYYDSDTILDLTIAVQENPRPPSGSGQLISACKPCKAVELVTRLSNSPRQTTAAPEQSAAVEVETRQGIPEKSLEKSGAEKVSESVSEAMNIENSGNS